MARNALISEKRFNLIEARQGHIRWGAEYQPAMRATRDEAPKISRPSTLYWAKLGRDLHFMSVAERHVCLLALYHPRVFDIHEQHALQQFKSPHPLAGHKDAYGLSLPPLLGTVAVAESLGIISKHPVVYLQDKNSDAESRHAFPYLGDLLLFLSDEQGPYCVNWNVKACRENFFDNPRQRRCKAVSTPVDTYTTLSARHRLEQQYFADANIPTHFIAAQDLDLSVTHNLNSLCAKAQAPSSLPLEAQEQLIHIFKDIIGKQTTVLSLLPSLSDRFQCKYDELLRILYRAIWYRRIRVDLYRPILPDKPLKAERSDILIDYAHLFGR